MNWLPESKTNKQTTLPPLLAFASFRGVTISTASDFMLSVVFNSQVGRLENIYGLLESLLQEGME